MILRSTYDKIYDNLKITTLLSYETKMCIGWQRIAFTSYYMFRKLHIVEPLRYDSVLIKETNE